MAWRRPGHKPLSELVMVRLPTHINGSLGLNELRIVDSICKCIFYWKFYFFPFWFKFHLTLCLSHHWSTSMVWCQTGDKPLHEPIMTKFILSCPSQMKKKIFVETWPCVTLFFELTFIVCMQVTYKTAAGVYADTILITLHLYSYQLLALKGLMSP